MCQISVTCEYGDHFVRNHGEHPVPVIDMLQVTKPQLEKAVFLIWPNTGRGEIKTHQASSSHERPYFLCKHNLTAGTREGVYCCFTGRYKPPQIYFTEGF